MPLGSGPVRNFLTMEGAFALLALNGPTAWRRQCHPRPAQQQTVLHITTKYGIRWATPREAEAPAGAFPARATSFFAPMRSSAADGVTDKRSTALLAAWCWASTPHKHALVALRGTKKGPHKAGPKSAGCQGLRALADQCSRREGGWRAIETS